MRSPSRKLYWLAIAAALIAIPVLGPYLEYDPDGPAALTSSAGGARGNDDVRDALTVRWQLPERATLPDPRADLFRQHSWQPPTPKVAARPATPTAPPLPYRYAGMVRHGHHGEVLLARGNDAFPVREGDILDENYRVKAISDTQVTLVYLPLGQQAVIEVISGLSPAGSMIHGQVPSDSTAGMPAGINSPAWRAGHKPDDTGTAGAAPAPPSVTGSSRPVLPIPKVVAGAPEQEARAGASH